MKKVINRAKGIASLLACYFFDFVRFVNESQVLSLQRNQNKERAHMLRIAHALEKGMAMPAPRHGFGLTKAKELSNFVKDYILKWGVDSYSNIAVASINSLLAFHKLNGVDVKALEDHIGSLEICARIQAGTIEVATSEIKKFMPNDPENFFLSRYSVRQFTSEKIEAELLEKLARIAAKTPSVCNRQSCKAYFYTDRALIDSILKLQDGNSGFGHTAAAIAVVTSDVSAFYKAGERYQGYVDGGLFAMSLVYAAHGLGLGSCMLNWSQATRTDLKMRRRLRLNNSEIIVTLIAFGHIPENFTVAASPRRPLGDVYSLNRELGV